MGEVEDNLASNTNYDDETDTETNDGDKTANNANKNDVTDTETKVEENSENDTTYDDDTDTEMKFEENSTNRTNENAEKDTKAKNVEWIEIEIEKVDGKFVCKICGNLFLTESACISHRRYCRKLLAKRFCKLCKEQFKSDKDFKAHVMSLHKIKTGNWKAMRLKLDIGCPKCDRKFSTKNYLELHKRKCKGQTLSKFCKKCNVTFCSETSLQRHMKRRRHERKKEEVPEHKEDPADLDCKNCGRSFKRKSDLTKHINLGCKFEEFSAYTSYDDETDTETSNIDNTGTVINEIDKTDNETKVENTSANNTSYDTETKDEDNSTSNMNKNDNTDPDAKVVEMREIKVERVDDKLQCKICGKQFLTESACISHGKYCKKNLAKRFCKSCKVQFQSDQDFKAHVMSVHKVKSELKNGAIGNLNALRLKLDIGCPKCDRKFSAKNHLELHVRTCKGQTLSKFCKQCNVTFCSETSLRRHMRRRHERKEEPVPDCEKCGRSFQRKSDRTKHINGGCNFEGYNNNYYSNQVNCEECGVKFSWIRDLRRHQKVGCEEDAKKKMRTCPLCDSSFTDRTGFRRHMEKQHGGIKMIPCEVCDQKFSSEYALERHMTHHRENKRLICHICGNDFKFREGLNRHLKKHAGLRFFCDQCPKSFTARHTLKRHKLWHEGVRPYVCEQCGDTFREKSKLQRHIALHAGIRSHECKTCHKKFVLKEYLKSHERMHITQNQKLISCDLCSYKTFRPECMKTHKKTHFMRRDFQCKICERKFSQKHSLEYHQKLHERTRSKCRPAFVTKPSLFCKHCPKGFTTKRGLVRHTQKHIKGILPVLIPGGIAGKGDPQEENVENDVPLQPDHTAPQNCSEITKPHLSDKPKGKKRKRSELSAGETLPNENALNNNQNGTLGETGSLIKSTISNFSDMNIAEGIIVPADRHGMQVVNNEMLNALRWTVPDGRAENVHVPQVVVGNRGIGLQGGELYHTMSDVERLTAPVALAAPVRLVENAANISELMDRNNKMLREPVFGRESAFGLYAPPNMINIPESSATGIPPWASCRFSQPQDLTSKFGAAQGDFGINVTTSKFGTVQEEFGGNVGSKLHVVEANYKAEYNTSNQSNHSGNITALNDAPISLVRHEGDHDNAFDEDTDIENYDDDLQFDNTANDDNKVAIKKDSSENSKDDDFLCDVQCNKCSAKFFSFNQLKMHLMKGCGQSTCHK